jgi:type IV fimbrial biogenesis protein FimT
MRLPYIRSVRGFTLIELMVTVAVVAILAVTAAPSLREFFERYELRGAAEDVLSALANARQGAVEADRNVKVRFSATTDNWCVGGIQQAEPTAGQLVAVDPAPCQCETSPATCVVGGEPLIATVAGRDVTMGAGGTTITFDSKNGTLNPLTPQNVTFLSSTGRYGLQVQISALGQARACRPADKAVFPGFSTC